MKSYRNIRVIPVVLVAIFALAVLKIAGLVLDGGYVFDYASPRPQAAAKQVAKLSWAQENLNFPGGIRDDDVTGSVDKPKEEKKEEKKDEAPKPAAPETKPDGVAVNPQDNHPISASEKAILERLQSRRQELEERAREIDIRESLLKAAEKRVESKTEEMKAVESKIAAASEQKGEADNARLKGIVTMYEGMKPKDAARVFDRLEMPVLIEIATQIAPRKMSDILGLMSSDAAERLTVEMARRANGDKSAQSAELPKIEGKMLPQKAN
jgi:flagellar motility protein MotE (MotC chaperone)